MSKGLIVARVVALASIAILAGTAGAQTRSCWLRDAAAPAKSVIHTMCEQGVLWTSTDGGTTWSRREIPATEKLRAMAFVDANRAYVVGDKGMMLATEDGGTKWQPRTIDAKEHLMDITFVGESGWTAGYRGVVLHTDDGGKTWTKQKTGTTQTLETVFFLDADHGWVVGWAGTILRTSDAGKTWEPIHCDVATWSLTSVYFRDLKNGWMVGFAGQVLRSRDGGATWQLQESPIKSWLYSVTFDSANRGWITWDDGFLVSEDAGETWKSVSVGRRYFLSKLLQVDQSLWAIGQSVAMKQSDGLTWSKVGSLAPGTVLPPSIVLPVGNSAPPRGTLE